MTFDSFFGPGMFNVYLYSDVGGAPDSMNPIFLGADGFNVPGRFSTLVSLPVSGNVPMNAGSSY
jgi:hypothetical protein